MHALCRASPEREGEPADVGRVPTLPEIDDTLEVILDCLVLIVRLTSFLRRPALGLVQGHPVATEEHVAVLAVEVT